MLIHNHQLTSWNYLLLFLYFSKQFSFELAEAFEAHGWHKNSEEARWEKKQRDLEKYRKKTNNKLEKKAKDREEMKGFCESTKSY